MACMRVVHGMCSREAEELAAAQRLDVVNVSDPSQVGLCHGLQLQSPVENPCCSCKLPTVPGPSKVLTAAVPVEISAAAVS